MKKKISFALAAMMLSATVFSTALNTQQKLLSNVDALANPEPNFNLEPGGGSGDEEKTKWVDTKMDIDGDTVEDEVRYCVITVTSEDDNCTPGDWKRK